MGNSHRRSGYRYRQPGFPECSGHRGRVPCRKWHLPGRLGNPLEGHLIDCSDHCSAGRWDDHFDHSPDNDYDHWRHCTRRRVSARFRMGWKLKASSLRRSRGHPFAADPQGSSKAARARRPGVSGPAHSNGNIGSARSRVIPTPASPTVANRKAAVITVRRSTLVRMGVGAVVLAALVVGFAVGWVISSSPYSPSTSKVVTEAGTTPTPSPPATTRAASTATPASQAPSVASCIPGSEPQVRPTKIDIGCGGHISISTVTWSSWGPSTGSGSGILKVNNCQPSCAAGSVRSSPAFVVVSNPVSGVFKDVLITPPSGQSTPQSSSQPGSGWGSG